MIAQTKTTAAHRWTGVDWLLVAALFVFVMDAGVWLQGLRAGIVWGPFGGDYATYHAASLSWLGGTGFYHPYQLAGPYDVFGRGAVNDPILYPPPVALLLLPAMVIAPLWWIAPLAIVGWSLRGLSRSGWLLVLALALWPSTVAMVWYGNPGMWIAAFLALATRWAFFAPFVLVKFTLAPLALYRVRERGWWAGLGALALLCLAFAPMWPDYVRVLLNARQDQGIFYSVYQSIGVLIPLVATRPDRT